MRCSVCYYCSQSECRQSPALLTSGLSHSCPVQLLPGSGWVLEPYKPSPSAPIDPSRTLINYLAHVSQRDARL